MNNTVKVLVASGLIGVGSLLVASKFIGDQAIEDAKTYVKDSYSLLETYDKNQKGLKEEIEVLETQLEYSNSSNDELSFKLEKLREELDAIEVEKGELLDKIKELEEQIENGETGVDTLRAELEKANLEISRANTKVEELESLIKEQDLSKFDPNGGTQYPVITKEIDISVGDLASEQSFVMNDGYVKAFGKHYRYDSFLVTFDANEISQGQVEIKGYYTDGTTSSFGTYINNNINLILGGKYIDSNGHKVQSIECKFLNSESEVKEMIRYNFNWVG